MNKYPLGSIFVSGHVDERRADDLGGIIIGGDRGDLWAYYASNTTDGRVQLNRAVLVSTLEDLTQTEVLSIAHEIVDECYASVQEDTFAPTKRYDEPTSEPVTPFYQSLGPDDDGCFFVNYYYKDSGDTTYRVTIADGLSEAGADELEKVLTRYQPWLRTDFLIDKPGDIS